MPHTSVYAACKMETDEKRMKLSKNFTLLELTKSATSTRLGIDNTPTQEQIRNLSHLCVNVLQPVRDKFGAFTVSSGFRSKELNTVEGGAANSDHLAGMAADFEIVGVDNKELAKWIAENLSFKQLILEFYKNGIANSGWIHCSFSEKENNNQVLRALKQGDKTVYKHGL